MTALLFVFGIFAAGLLTGYAVRASMSLARRRRKVEVAYDDLIPEEPVASWPRVYGGG